MAEKQQHGRPDSVERPLRESDGRDINAGRDKSAGDHHRPVPIEKVSNTVKPPAIPPGKPKG